MRHRKSGRQFGRNASNRRAMMKNLTANLLLHERIETTEAKAKELRRVAERLITKALRLGDDLVADLAKMKQAERHRVVARRLHVQRQMAAYLPFKVVRTLPDGTSEEVNLVQKLFEGIAPRYLDRVKAGKGGGYTRIIKELNRRGDNASMSLIELVQ
jgi:large subunit ribosomal protein L17